MSEMDEIISQLITHHWILDKDRTGILLIDLQEYFREIITPILVNLIGVISTARERTIPLFFTQHGNEPGEKPSMLAQWWTDLIIKGSHNARLISDLDIREGDSIIPKTTYSAFYNTDLEGKLKDNGITDLVIGGVMTNLCCETTARDAFVRDFRVFFLADGTSTVSEDFHLATLKNVGCGFATLMGCDQLIKILNT
jgi:nicotinamidase-related amidase